jgi:hypothetical protein
VKPLALDLFCGKGGWTQGLLDTGWDVLGIDIEDMGGYPDGAKLVLADVLNVAKDAVAWVAQHDPRPVSLVTASPPCQEFSYSSFPFRLAREKFTPENPPDKSLWRAAESIAKQLGAPLLLENVRGAVKWMGPAVNRFGPFYLWGDVPALMPTGKPQKGFGRAPDKSANPSDPWGGFGGSSYQSRGKRGPLNIQRAEKRDGYKRMVGSEKYRGPEMSASRDSAPMNRKEWSAKAAMIPYDLAYHIGSVFLPKEVKPQ